MIQNEEGDEDACVGSMRILNALKAKSEVLNTKKKELLFVEANIQGTLMRAVTS